MKLDDEIIPVVAGDAVYIPPHVKHQMLNPSDEWLVHLLVQGNNLDPALQKQPVTTRNWVPAASWWRRQTRAMPLSCTCSPWLPW